MMTLEHVLDRAKERANLRSDRELGRAIGSSNPSYISFYRTRNVLPSDGQMIRLAELAEMDPNEALLWLNVWRAKDETAKSRYKKMIATIASAAALIAMAPAIPQLSQDVAISSDHENLRVLNIMRNIRRRLIAMARRIFRPGSCKRSANHDYAFS